MYTLIFVVVLRFLDENVIEANAYFKVAKDFPKKKKRFS